MKTKFFLFSIISFFTYQLYSNEINYVQRAMLIFLDDSEKDISVISNNLITALYQNAGPIIASRSLLINIFFYAGNAAYLKNKSAKELVELFQPARFRQDEEGIFEKKYIISKAMAFDPIKWVIKKINDELYLFLPYEYLKALKINIDAVKAYSKDITPTELILGLKVNHMENVEFRKINKNTKDYAYATYFMDALNNKKTRQSAIFCTRGQYFKNKFKSIPIWSFFMSGHGDIWHSIIHLNLEDFRKVLKFFERKINTKLLVYDSCFSQGINAREIYQNIKTSVQKNYSFAIIGQGVPDVATITDQINIENDFGNLKLKTKVNYNKFLKLVTNKEILNYQEIAQQVYSVVAPKEEAASRHQLWGDIPQIKLPGLEWFSVLADGRDIVSIGSILAKTHDPKKPLDILQFFKADPKALLLYAKNIPFELIIDGYNLEAIISMLPGLHIHTIKRIIASKNNSYEVLQWFNAIEHIGSQKIFFIKTINDMSDVIVANYIDTTYSNYIFFKKNNISYMQKDRGSIDKLTNKNLIKKYQQLLEQSKNQIEDASRKDIEKIESIFTPEHRSKMQKKRLALEMATKQRKQKENLEQLGNALSLLQQSLTQLQRVLTPAH